jgi:FtsP/CotA-like multicopper oxidase with cupredoxin domain
MGWASRWLLAIVLAIVLCGLSAAELWAQCPARPDSGTVVSNPFSISSQNGVLSAELTMEHSVDKFGYTHYCYEYSTGSGIAEAPTLRLNRGDELVLNILNRIKDDDPMKMKMTMAPTSDNQCGDGGDFTIDSTNVHFHGMNIPPKCHQDDVLTTLIQPGHGAFKYDIRIPQDQKPGLYWYHPHVHGFTEFQVNGGAAGALIVEGMEKIHPEVAGLSERVFVIRQQYLVPWVPGPYQLTVNYQVSPLVGGNASKPVIQMKPGEKQFWRVVNATIQDFLPLQVIVNGQPIPLQVVALDGYPLVTMRNQQTILVPPAGRAEFIVQGPAAGASAVFYTGGYSTGPTGNPDIAQTLATIQVSDQAASSPMPKAAAAAEDVDTSNLAGQSATAERKIYFSEEFGGTNGPIQFYITVDGQKQKVFEADEKPVITTKVGAIEDWTIENRALETHAFHMHQIHFLVMEVDGKPVPHQDLRDTIEIPYWEGKGAFHSVKVRMDFRDPRTAGMFVFHCHVLLHEDLGMMHKLLVEP